MANAFPPGGYVAAASQQLPEPGPDVPAQTVEIDAGKLWGRYRVTFVPRRNPRRGMRAWFWGTESGEQIAPPTQKYQHFLTSEVLNEQARWVPVRIPLSPDDANAFLSVGGRDLEKNPRALELVEQAYDAADVRNLQLRPVAQA